MNVFGRPQGRSWRPVPALHGHTSGRLCGHGGSGRLCGHGGANGWVELLKGLQDLVLGRYVLSNPFRTFVVMRSVYTAYAFGLFAPSLLSVSSAGTVVFYIAAVRPRVIGSRLA